MVVVALFATGHKRYNQHRLSCDMEASRSRPCNAMKNIWLVVALCNLASLIAVNLVVIASGDTTYQGTLIVVVSQSTALIAVIL